MSDYPSHKGTQLDIEQWSRMPVWEWWVLPDILLGYEPNWRPQSSADRERLRKMQEWVRAASRANELHCVPPDCVSPAVVVEWVRRRRIPVAKSFEVLVAALDEQGLLSVAAPPIENPSKPGAEKPLNAKERDSLHRMIVALARQVSGKQEIEADDVMNLVRTIRSKATLSDGTTLDDATVRKHLRDAVATTANRAATAKKSG